MASAASVGTAGLLIPVFAPLSALTVAYAGHKLVHLPWRRLLRRFFTGPGRLSRILLLFFLVTNGKSLVFAWTARVFASMFRHVLLKRGPLPHRALFHYSITTTRTTLLETDYNLHKSNSTYFGDLDVSRSHLVMHLFGRGMKAVGENAKTMVVRDKSGAVVQGGFGIGLGSVFCSFKKEIAPYQQYEIWSRILAWDRKWLYIVTHFVVKGKVLPTSWDSRTGLSGRGKVRRVVAGGGKGGGKAEAAANGSTSPAAADLEKHVIATAVSKYVFKLGRFTVHPAIVIENSGLLPERPGDGWRGGDTETGTPEELPEDFVVDRDDDDDDGGVWDWRRTEWERRQGLAYAEHFAALDGLNGTFDGGRDGALGWFSPG